MKLFRICKEFLTEYVQNFNRIFNRIIKEFNLVFLLFLWAPYRADMDGECAGGNSWAGNSQRGAENF